jgi:chromosome segregation ATPase
MTLAMMNTHKAFKALQLAGVSDQQAEAMVEIFTEMQQDNALSRADLMNAGEGIKDSIIELDVRLSGAVKDLDLRLQELDKRLSGAIHELDVRLSSAIQELDVRLSGAIRDLDVRLSNVEVRLDRMEKDIAVLKADVSELKTDMRWIKRLLMVMATTMAIAAIKYIFS